MSIVVKSPHESKVDYVKVFDPGPECRLSLSERIIYSWAMYRARLDQPARPADAERLLGISRSQASRVLNSLAGAGLIVAGKAVAPPAELLKPAKLKRGEPDQRWAYCQVPIPGSGSPIKLADAYLFGCLLRGWRTTWNMLAAAIGASERRTASRAMERLAGLGLLSYSCEDWGGLREVAIAEDWAKTGFFRQRAAATGPLAKYRDDDDFRALRADGVPAAVARQCVDLRSDIDYSIWMDIKTQAIATHMRVGGSGQSYGPLMLSKLRAQAGRPEPSEPAGRPEPVPAPALEDRRRALIRAAIGGRSPGPASVADQFRDRETFRRRGATIGREVARRWPSVADEAGRLAMIEWGTLPDPAGEFAAAEVVSRLEDVLGQ